MARVLITRPAERAAATARRIEAMGHEAIVLPLFDAAAVEWTDPREPFDALMLTSAAAPRFAGNQLSAYRDLPCYCIGEQTAAAACANGLNDVRAPSVDGVAALLARMADDGVRQALHLRGADVTETVPPAGLGIVSRAVYAAHAVRWTEAERARAASADVALVYSPRAARALAGEMRGARLRQRIAALSPAVAEAAGGGWAEVAMAASPTEDALFAAAGLLCENPA